MGKDALAVMLKFPEPGKVKTRLVPPLTHLEACGLYECFIKDTFNKAVGLEAVDIFAAYTPYGMEERLKEILPDGINFLAQEGDGLGDRMYNVFKALFAKGYERVSLIGTDSPDLPSKYIKESFRLLGGRGKDIVIGPAKDGGYYLIAMDGLKREPFVEIEWSTGSVLEATLKRLEGHEVRLLEKWHDIDTVSDMEALGDGEAPLTARFIKGLRISP